MQPSLPALYGVSEDQRLALSENLARAQHEFGPDHPRTLMQLAYFCVGQGLRQYPMVPFKRLFKAAFAFTSLNLALHPEANRDAVLTISAAALLMTRQGLRLEAWSFALQGYVGLVAEPCAHEADKARAAHVCASTLVHAGRSEDALPFLDCAALHLSSAVLCEDHDLFSEQEALRNLACQGFKSPGLAVTH